MRFLKTYAVLLIIITSFAIFSSLETVVAEDYFHESFEWYYKGSRWTWELQIPKSLYNSYKKVSIFDRTKYGVGGYDFLVTTQDSYVEAVADELHEAAVKEGYEAYDEVSFVLAFVQSLPYTSDSVTTMYDEYPRFPIETLVDGGGDCEDTSILFATIVLILNYDAVFISVPSHLAVGVWGTDLYGSYYTYNSKNYYYCETTGENWKIGDLPDEYQDTKAYLYSIDQYSQYEPTQALFDPENGIESFDLLSSIWLEILPLVVLLGIVIGIAICVIYVSRKLTKSEVTVEKEEPMSSYLSLLNTKIKQSEVNTRP